jgi:hemerythrin-like domain-containing protein
MTMTHLAMRVIQDEHQALSAMLRSMTMLLAQARRERQPPPFDVLRAMLFYVDEFPEKLHHTKESALLFPKVRARCPELAPVLDRLDRDHAQGERAIRDLQHALLAYESLGESRRVNFETALDLYLGFYLAHMRTEEQDILPAARAHLDEADWAELDAAFAANRDPMTGHDPDEEFRPLFRKIVMTAPSPVGLG